MIEKFSIVATGGTFDEIHTGHITLLAKAFEVGDKVIIGVSSDEFAVKRSKKLKHGFEERVENLKKIIRNEFKDVNYEIAKLDEDFGPAVTSGPVRALVASIETGYKANTLNEIRTRNGLRPVKIITVELVKAEDGLPISSTRIKAGEIDNKGRLLKKYKSDPRFTTGI